MLISHSKKFIFIHNFKVAGTSIRNALYKYSNHSFRESSIKDMLLLMTKAFPPIYSTNFPGHITAKELRIELPEKVFNNYFKFGFVRNPWDWQVSLYSFMLNNQNHYQHKLVKSMKDFDEYIDWRVNKDLYFQKDFFFDEEGNCLVDFIGKLEKLSTDFNKICQKLNLKSSLPHLNKSRDTCNFLSHYSVKSFDIISEVYKDDISLFEYSKSMSIPSDYSYKS